MAATTAKLRIVLAIGVGAAEHHHAPTVEKFAAQEQARALQAGFDVDFFLIDKNAANIQDQLKEKLRDRQYEGVMIGFGVRGNQTCTEVFEQAVNICAQQIKPIPKFAFNSKPTDSTEAIQRAFAQY